MSHGLLQHFSIWSYLIIFDHIWSTLSPRSRVRMGQVQSPAKVLCGDLSAPGGRFLSAVHPSIVCRGSYRPFPAEEKWKDRGGNWGNDRNARIYHWTFTFLGSPRLAFRSLVIDGSWPFVLIKCVLVNPDLYIPHTQLKRHSHFFSRQFWTCLGLLSAMQDVMGGGAFPTPLIFDTLW